MLAQPRSHINTFGVMSSKTQDVLEDRFRFFFIRASKEPAEDLEADCTCLRRVGEPVGCAEDVEADCRRVEEPIGFGVVVEADCPEEVEKRLNVLEVDCPCEEADEKLKDF